MLLYSLTNFEIQRYYQNEPRFNGVFSRGNLLDRINDEGYVINLDEYSDVGTLWITFYAINNNVTYFNSFGVEPIPKEIRIFIDGSITITNIFRIQAYDSVMCRYFCTGFVDFMLKDKTLTYYTNLFSPNIFFKKW